MRYYRVRTDDKHFADRWFLDEPLAQDGTEIDAREFAYGRPYAGAPPNTVPIQYAGRVVAFNLAAFDMPVVSDEIADLVERIAPGEAERYPVTIGSGIQGYSILNAICREACVDETRSLVTRWGPGDFRQDKIGRYRMVSNLTVDPSRANGRHIFRIEDFEVALLVSEVLKDAIERIPNNGVKFEPAS